MARDYKHEASLESPERKKARSDRNKARRLKFKQLSARHGPAVAKRMMEGKDVDHKKPVALGGKTKLSNLRLRDPSENSSDKRKLFAGKRTTRPKNPKKD
jgi:hypothetical protein